MFEFACGTGTEPDGFDGEPMPDEPDYIAFRASFAVYESQQDAYWSAVSRGEIPVVDGLPDPAASRTDAGLLDAAARAERLIAQAEGEKLHGIAQYTLRQIANPAVGYDEDAMVRSVEAEVGLRFRLSPGVANDLVVLAMTLTRRLPQTFAALRDGALGIAKVRAIADET